MKQAQETERQLRIAEQQSKARAAADLRPCLVRWKMNSPGKAGLLRSAHAGCWQAC